MQYGHSSKKENSKFVEFYENDSAERNELLDNDKAGEQIGLQNNQNELIEEKPEETVMQESKHIDSSPNIENKFSDQIIELLKRGIFSKQFRLINDRR